MALPALFFDLDGTLTDPSPGFLASIRHAMTMMAASHRTDAELVRFIGPPLRETMGTILATTDVSRIEEGVELYRERLDAGGKFEAHLHEGIEALLEKLDALGHPLFVCTGKPECVAGEIVAHFGLDRFFRHVYGAKLDGLHADKADLIRHIHATEDLPPAPPIMIGDTIFDMRAAKETGCHAIGVRWGFGVERELREAGADRIVETVAELESAISGFSPSPAADDTRPA